MELILVLHNIRSVYNVGAILRTLEGFGGKRAVFSGYTPYPGTRPGVLPHVAEKISAQISKTALGTEKLIKTEWVDNLTEELEALKDQNYKIVGLENNLDDGQTLALNTPGIREKLGEKVVLVLGEEVSGIPEDIREKIEIFLEIPMHGQKESFNVSVAAGIALYQLLA